SAPAASRPARSGLHATSIRQQNSSPDGEFSIVTLEDAGFVGYPTARSGRQTERASWREDSGVLLQYAASINGQSIIPANPSRLAVARGLPQYWCSVRGRRWSCRWVGLFAGALVRRRLRSSAPPPGSLPRRWV